MTPRVSGESVHRVKAYEPKPGQGARPKVRKQKTHEVNRV